MYTHNSPKRSYGDWGGKKWQVEVTAGSHTSKPADRWPVDEWSFFFEPWVARKFGSTEVTDQTFQDSIGHPSIRKVARKGT